MTYTETKSPGWSEAFDAVAAPCPQCAAALRPVGFGRALYWSCGQCGTTMRRH